MLGHHLNEEQHVNEGNGHYKTRIGDMTYRTTSGGKCDTHGSPPPPNENPVDARSPHPPSKVLQWAEEVSKSCIAHDLDLVPTNASRLPLSSPPCAEEIEAEDELLMYGESRDIQRRRMFAAVTTGVNYYAPVFPTASKNAMYTASRSSSSSSSSLLSASASSSLPFISTSSSFPRPARSPVEKYVSGASPEYKLQETPERIASRVSSFYSTNSSSGTRAYPRRHHPHHRRPSSLPSPAMDSANKSKRSTINSSNRRDSRRNGSSSSSCRRGRRRDGREEEGGEVSFSYPPLEASVDTIMSSNSFMDALERSPRSSTSSLGSTKVTVAPLARTEELSSLIPPIYEEREGHRVGKKNEKSGRSGHHVGYSSTPPSSPPRGDPMSRKSGEMNNIESRRPCRRRLPLPPLVRQSSHPSIPSPPGSTPSSSLSSPSSSSSHHRRRAEEEGWNDMMFGSFSSQKKEGEGEEKMSKKMRRATKERAGSASRLARGPTNRATRRSRSNSRGNRRAPMQRPRRIPTTLTTRGTTTTTLANLPTYSSTSFVRAYVSKSDLSLTPAVIVSGLTAIFIMIICCFLQRHVLDTLDHLGLFLIGSYLILSSYYTIYYFLERYSLSFQRIQSTQKKFYIIGNLIKAGVLISITPFAAYHLTKMIVFDEWDTQTLQSLGSIYVIPDFISLMIVKRMRWSTWMHHLCVVLFNYFSIMNDYRDENVLRCVVVYAGFSSFAYCVNVLLASRFLGLSPNAAHILSFFALLIYGACCAVNWSWQVYYLHRLLTTGHQSWPIMLYICLIVIVVYDDLVLNKWLWRYASNMEMISHQPHVVN